MAKCTTVCFRKQGTELIQINNQVRQRENAADENVARCIYSIINHMSFTADNLCFFFLFCNLDVQYRKQKAKPVCAVNLSFFLIGEDEY